MWSHRTAVAAPAPGDVWCKWSGQAVSTVTAAGGVSGGNGRLSSPGHTRGSYGCAILVCRTGWSAPYSTWRTVVIHAQAVAAARFRNELNVNEPLPLSKMLRHSSEPIDKFLSQPRQPAAEQRQRRPQTTGIRDTPRSRAGETTLTPQPHASRSLAALHMAGPLDTRRSNQ